ncbi:MAG: Methylthioribose-1-phosphate isomerase [Gemmatimonadaceae bacterium]|nr:Methylthioribose-1-phosphate isomerase [Gemmatimonadaceae bacterium]
MHNVEAVRWSPEGLGVRIIDQRLLPADYCERDLWDVDTVCEAIRSLAVRGAPAIGICGAMGLVASASAFRSEPIDLFRRQVRELGLRIRGARPTAVNLPWAIDRMLDRLDATSGNAQAIIDALHDEASAMLAEDRAMCRSIAEQGVSLIADGARVLTHCNAGALATTGMGTALAPIYLAVERGKKVEVLVGETRPLLQGSRLTAWELTRADIPVMVLTDSMVASLMRAGGIDLCLVGADRIAANGDVANKIGTYGIAVHARHHGLPFYVAAPASTLDARSASGDVIEIEQRSRDEVVRPFGAVVAPTEVGVWNPAFDVTPADLVTAIITDRGVFRGPFDFSGAERLPDWRG